MKTILVPLLGDVLDDSALSFAYTAGAKSYAHIHALHVRHNPVDEVLLLTIGGGKITRELWNKVELEIGCRHDNARNSFERFCKTRSIQVCDTPETLGAPSASWQQLEGDLVAEVSRQARFHDLVVVSRGDATSGFTSRELGEILIRCGRPLLIASGTIPAPEAFETVAIAWKDTVEAAHMMTAAMPILEAAKRVVVLMASEYPDPSVYDKYAEHLTTELKWHGLEPEIRQLVPGEISVAEALVDAAAKAGADLLVLGGYGHSRARELVFGGVTRHMLDKTHFPVFIVH